jgi:hypothetical protein
MEGRLPRRPQGFCKRLIYVSKAPFHTSAVLLTPTVNGGSGGISGSPGTIYRDFKPRGTMFSAW